MKNMGICTATGVSRAAIRGGLDPQLAFSMSDLYIQKLELMRDVATVERLGVAAFMVTDGPHALRKQAGKSDHLGLNASVPATCFPTAAATACWKTFLS